MPPQSGAVVQASPTRSTIPTGPATDDYNLNTVSALTGPRDFLPFFAGQNVRRPGSVSTYAVVTEYHDSCDIVDVRYYTFNPYSYGKEICVGFGLGPFCFGQGSNSIENFFFCFNFGLRNQIVNEINVQKWVEEK